MFEVGGGGGDGTLYVCRSFDRRLSGAYLLFPNSRYMRKAEPSVYNDFPLWVIRSP